MAEKLKVKDIDIKVDDVKIATKEEALWISVQKNLQNTITNLEKELTVNKAFLELATKNVDIEKNKK